MMAFTAQLSLIYYMVMSTIFWQSLINCIVHMRDEHVYDVLLHTHSHIHKYSDFLICMIYVGLTLVRPNDELATSTKFIKDYYILHRKLSIFHTGLCSV